MVLRLLVNTGKLTYEQAKIIKEYYPKGFHINGQIRDTLHDRKAGIRLAEYMIRQPVSESRIINYTPQSSSPLVGEDKRRGERSIVTLKVRSLMDKEGKRRYEYEKIGALEFLARLLQHIPSKGQKMVNYYGLYSNKTRGIWKMRGLKPRRISEGKMRNEFKSSWAKFIWKVYHVNPLKCPHCGGNLKIVDMVFENCKKELGIISKKKWLYPPNGPPS